jgi:hypothetical protein
MTARSSQCLCNARISDAWGTSSLQGMRHAFPPAVDLLARIGVPDATCAKLAKTSGR